MFICKLLFTIISLFVDSFNYCQHNTIANIVQKRMKCSHFLDFKTCKMRQNIAFTTTNACICTCNSPGYHLTQSVPTDL